MKDIRNVINKINQVHVSSYPVWVLEKTIDDLEQKQQEIANQLSILELEISKEIEVGNTSPIKEIQDQARKMEQEYQSLTEEIQTLFNYRQEKILKERIINGFGSQFLYLLKEYIITLLVLFVLGLLVYESTTPDLPVETLKLFFVMDVGCCVIFLANFF